MPMEWTQALPVGVDAIDAQHKRLFELLAHFNEDIDSLSGLDCLTDKTKKLRIYMTILNLRTFFLEHFSTEERYMMKSRYPDFLEHKKEHDLFIMKVFEFERRFLGGSLSIAKEINDFLKMWTRKHTTGTDGRYVPHFKRHFRPADKAPQEVEELVESQEPAAGPDPEPPAGPDPEPAAGPDTPQEPTAVKGRSKDLDDGPRPEHSGSGPKK